MDIFILIILVVLLVVIIAAVVAGIKVVPQEQRLVIHQFGRFHRIAGPGLVLIIPYLDQVVRVIEVREHPVEISVSGVFAFGVSNDLTLNLFYRFDPEKAAGDDRDRLIKILQMTDDERHRQVGVKIREALVNQIGDLQKRKPLPEGATGLDGVIALAPGTDHYKELIKGINDELEESLPLLGVILNTTHSITLTHRGIPDEIIKAVKRRYGRDIDSQWLTKYARELRKQFPDMSRTMLAQMLSSIEGVDLGNIQRLLLEQDADVETEFEMSEDVSKPNIITKPKTKARQPESSKTGRKDSQTPRRLTKSDLTVLKRVPRGDQDQRLSA